MSGIATRQDDPLAKLRRQVDALGPELKNALPSHIKPEKFQRVVMTVVQQQPELLQADRRSLFASCMKCAADGLVPDSREAALVIFNTKVKIKDNGVIKEVWEKRVQYMPMMAGVLKRVRNSGEIASVQAHVIYEHDQFLIRRGLSDTLEHTPLFPGERGRAIGAYAVAKFKDGSDPQFEVMDLNQINKVRAVSKSKDGPTWTQHWDEMARKTVFRRLSKWLPMDAETESVMRRDDEVGTIDHVAPAVDAIVGQDRQQVAQPSKLDALVDESGDASEVPEYITEDGEVISGTAESVSDTQEDPLAASLAKFYRDLAAAKSGTAIDQIQRTDEARALVKMLDDDENDRMTAAVAARRQAVGK